MRINKKLRNALLCAGAALALFLIINLPVFAIQEVTISGNQALSKEAVAEAAGLLEGRNFFLFSSRQAKKNILKNPYAESVTITKKLPSSIFIEIKERRAVGYIESQGDYIYIDGEGRVLDVRQSFEQRLPVVVGLKFQSVTKGEILQVEDQSAFTNVVLLANLFNAHGLEEDIIRVDVNQADDIHLYIHHLDVTLGSITDANEKIRNLKAILAKIEDVENIRADLYLNTAYKGEAGRLRILK